jgi:hypothetical protein
MERPEAGEDGKLTGDKARIMLSSWVDITFRTKSGRSPHRQWLDAVA